MRDSWEETTLAEFTSIQKGKISEQSESSKDGYLPIINTDFLRGNIKVWGKINGSVTCEKDDLLILWDGERSGLCATGNKGVVGSTFAKIKVNDSLFPEYLFRFIDFNFEWIQGQRTGTGVPHVPKNLNSIFRIYYPPLPQQQKIAQILSTCDAVLEKTEAAIAKYQAVKKGLLHDLFTRGINPDTGKLRPTTQDAPDLYKETELGLVPKEWEVKSLDEIGEIISGGTPSSTVEKFWNGKILWITPSDLSKLEISKINDSKRKITEIGLNNSSALLIQKDSIVISSRAPIGYCAIVTENFTTNQGCKSISLFEKNNTMFFYYNIIKNINRIKAKGEGTTFSEISKKALEKVEFPTCQFKEQNLIAHKLQSIDQKIESEQRSLAKYQSVKAGLMQDLLSGAVGVEGLLEKEEQKEINV